MKKHQRYGMTVMFFGLLLAINNTDSSLPSIALNVFGVLFVVFGAWLFTRD